ncbi:hypothetical protein PR003_g11015 [Phytophthora rubi]|uniref:Uncharacterized protein n=1 Tax=Phytophthora rubi TaxID=129364 RepID=A0A6A4FCR3_9STRA|nr:hypothetical protein PR001_g10612 [Phytophthora rubi]KAE9339435.1 hypothetical protein PR003_g11015 [Phytophthora rubi]
MGRKKSPTRKHSARCYVDPQASRSSSAEPETSSRLGDASPSSLRVLAAIDQEPTAMDTESSSDSAQLPGSQFQSLQSALPIGGNTHKDRKSRRKRRSSGDDGIVSRQEAAGDSNGEEEQEEVVTISVAELEKWQQRVILHVEDHFTNEQLKRIAEFGRVHGSVVQEAKQYVSNMEVQLRNQLEEERAVLRAQAEEFVTKTSAENEALKRRVEELEQQVEGLEKQVDKLKEKKAQTNQQQEEERHSPPNLHTQVQPRNGEVNGDTENHPINGRQDGKVAVDHCSTSKATPTDPHHDPHSEKTQLPVD